MEIRIILANLAGKDSDHAVLDAAYQVAEPHKAHISVGCMHQSGSTLFGSSDALDSGARQAAAREHEAQWHERYKLPSESAGAGSVTADWLEPASGGLIPIAQLADLSLVAHPGAWPDPTRHDLTTLLLDSGRPVLLVPASGELALRRHAVIAWNGSREAARALAFGFPLVAAAERVSIFSRTDQAAFRAGHGPKDLVDHLAWHGIRAEVAAGGEDDQPVAAALLGYCRDIDAGLLIAGANTHSSLLGHITGAATHHLLAEAKLPLLVMH